MKTLALLLLALTLAGPVQAQSTTHLWMPVRPDAGVTNVYASSVGLECFAWVAYDGITNANTIAWFLTAGVTSGAGLCSFTIYSADGNTRIATTGALNCATPGVKTGTGITPFSLLKGNKYQMCTCQGGSGGSYLGQSAGASLAMRVLQNSLSVPIATFGNNDCTVGVPPATTGGVFSAINAMMPIFYISTSTP